MPSVHHLSGRAASPLPPRCSRRRGGNDAADGVACAADCSAGLADCSAGLTAGGIADSPGYDGALRAAPWLVGLFDAAGDIDVNGAAPAVPRRACWAPPLTRRRGRGLMGAVVEGQD